MFLNLVFKAGSAISSPPAEDVRVLRRQPKAGLAGRPMDGVKDLYLRWFRPTKRTIELRYIYRRKGATDFNFFHPFHS